MVAARATTSTGRFRSKIRLGGQDAFGHQAENHSQQSCAECDTESTAEHGEHETLRQKLAEDLPARGSERTANRNLPIASRTFGQQQIGDIDAGDEQHKANRAEKKPEVVNAVGRQKVILQRLDGGAPTPIGSGICGGNMARHRVHIGLRLLQRNPGLHAPHRQQPVIVVIDLFRREGQRGRQFRAQAVRKTGRQHTNDRIIRAIEAHGLADDVAIRAQPVPQFVGQDDLMVLAGNSLLGKEIAPHQKGHSLQLKPSG